MTHVYSTRFRIRQYELDAHDELPNRVLAQLFQETAMRASADAGFPVEWYTEHRDVWVIHLMTLEHLRPIRYPDELEITTWLSDAEHVRTHREYLARNVRTGEIAARGRAFWAHLNRETMMPARIPPDIIGRLEPNGVRAVPRIVPRLYPPSPTESPLQFHLSRRIQHYESDALQHVNNALYLDWLEEALAQVTAGPSLRLCVRRHDIEYVRGALPGDAVEVATRLLGHGHSASSWRQEVARAGTMLVRDRVTAVWVDGDGRPVRWPESARVP